MEFVPANEFEDYKKGIKGVVEAVEQGQGNFSDVVKKFAILMGSEEITDIQIIGYDRIFLKKEGQYLLLEEQIFKNETELIALLNGLLAKSISTWKKIPDNPRETIKDPRKAEIETRLGDGSRIHITTPPISDNVSCTIAKFKRKRMTIRDILESGSLTDKMSQFLTWSVDARLSMLITGETGSGKTTLLQALAQRFGYERANEVVIVVEDTPELLIESKYTNAIDYWRVVHNESEVTNGGEKNLADLVKATLRRRMDRLVISEVRGEEAFYMVDANNTGTSGTLCTLHGNSAREALYRLMNLCLRSQTSGINIDSVTRDIGAAFQIVVHQTRDNKGRYIIREIIEVGIKETPEGPEFEFNPLFKYDASNETFKHVGVPSERLRDLAMQRAQLKCPDSFLKQDPYTWEE